MEKCYEYLGCDKHDCIMRDREDEVNCWEMEGTQCHHPGMKLMLEYTKDKCQFCIYRRFAKTCGAGRDSLELETS